MSPTPTDRSVKPGDAHVTHQRIAEAAERAFAAHGYEAASMSAIAKDAGIEKSSIYYFFESKEDLFAAVAVGVCHRLSDVVEKRVIQDNAKATTTREDGRKVLAATCLDFITEALRGGIAMTRMEGPMHGLAHSEEIHSMFEELQRHMLLFLERYGVKNPQIAQHAIGNAIHAYVLHSQYGKPQPPPNVYGDYLAELLIPS